METAAQTKRAAPKDALFTSYPDFYQNSAYAEFPQDVRSGGTYAQSMVRVDQDPIDLIDAALPDFVLTMALTNMQECSVDIGDGTHRFENAKKHTMMIYPARTEARTRVTNAHSILSFSLPQSHVSELLDRAGLPSNPFGAKVGRLFEDETASYLIRSIWQTANSSYGADDLSIDGLTLQLIAHLARQAHHTRGRTSCAQQAKPQLTAAVLSNINVYVEDKLDSRIRVKDLAQVAGMSEFRFIQCFKDVVGQTPYRYVLLRRLERAKQLLSDSDLSLAEISYSCGFSSQGHMNDQFRKCVGVTPGKYRLIRKS